MIICFIFGLELGVGYLLMTVLFELAFIGGAAVVTDFDVRFGRLEDESVEDF